MDSSTVAVVPSKGNVSASVQVALRIRPQGNREKLEGSRVCTSVIPNEPQVTIGGDRSFTYDFVYDQPTRQHVIFDTCIHRLVSGLFEGYNATVLAYGQTGSGKTYTMGTAFDTGLIKEEEVGVIPRAISFVFEQIARLKREAQENGILEPSFDVAVQFIELYNEEVIDLLSDDRSASTNVRIHEDNRGEIYLHGVTAKPVQDLDSTMEILKNGALNRTVASTNMNEQSSRSHAIFSLHIKQQRVIPSEGEDMGTGATEVEVISAKFHFVDLAGSERLKRTGATGDRAKEGISINSGLLALGNVISALGGANGKVGHVPYRDSKLTRLLQDSLGGNSQTLMIACVSPSDSDFVETLNTMKYANRAKNIKNKVVANQDKSSKLIGELRGRIASLEAELLEFKQGRRAVDANGVETLSDQYHENVMLTSEVNQLRFRVKALQETNEILRARNVELMAAKDAVLLAGAIEDGTQDVMTESGEKLDPVQATIRNYLEELEKTRSALYESHATSDQLRKEVARWKAQALAGGTSITATALSADSSPFSPNSFSQKQLIEEAKADLEKMRKQNTTSSAVNDSTSDYASHGETMDDCEDGTSNDADDIESDEDEAEGEDMVFEETREGCMLRDNLNDLQTEIGIKERLISELERSERRLAEVRLTYERKLTELSLRIKQTEAERDRVLSDSVSKKSDKASQEQAKRIRDEYERKLSDMKNEFRKLQMVEKEHKRMQARQERERQELVRYQNELKELKKVKVDLMKKIKEEMKKAQQVSMSNSKRLAKLDKDARTKENKIRLLESKDRQREQYVKRTNEEINRLRKAQREQQKQIARSTATPVRGAPAIRQPVRQVGKKNGQPPPEMTFSPKHAKIKWNMIEKKLARLVIQKQTVVKMEEELARLLKERHSLVDEISDLEKKFASCGQISERDDIMEEIDGVRQKLSYIQDQITEVQTSIVDVDATKENGDEADDTDSSSIEAILDHCSNIVEAKYLLQHLFSHSLEQGVLAANVKANNRELEAKVQHLEQQSFINEQLLSTVIEDKSLASDLESLENGMRRKSRSPSLQSMRAGSTSPSITDQSEPTLQLYKARRRTATTDEMLYPSPDSPTLPPSEKEKQTFEEKQNPEEERKERKRVDVPAFLPPSASATHPPSFARNTRLRSTYGGTSNSGRPPAAPSRGGRDVSAQSRGLSRMSSYSRLAAVAETIEEPSTSIGAAASVTSLPSSSSTKERSSTRDQRSVFARLIPSWSQEASPKTLINRKQGRIVSVRNDSSTRTRVVTRTHTLEGHSKAILACATTEDHLLTGSKDRTAKLWDLSTGQEIRTLGVHPNSVHSVKFVPNSNLALSISMYQVRVWDIRTDSCIRVLHSSGQIIEGDGGPVGSRQNTVPFLETVINSAEVDPYGRLLFTSFAGDVRIWNLEKWASFGRLVGASHSPRSEVSCLAVATGEDDAPFVFTGSRDHYVKMYEVNPAGEGVHEAAVEFSPPHYDNVTCTLAYKGNLFTASKDYNIMKFSLTDYKRDHLELKSHDGYVQGMCMVGINSNKPLLASVCREGTIKFWDVASSRRMKLVEEISKAHSGGINGICCNNYLMFTASSDQTVGFWKINADS